MPQTKGPWKLFKDFAFFNSGSDSQQRDWQRPVISERGEIVATCVGLTEEEANDNASLVATSTELLAALIVSVEYMARVSPKGERTSEVKRHRALIAKAKGIV